MALLHCDSFSYPTNQITNRYAVNLGSNIDIDATGGRGNRSALRLTGHTTATTTFNVRLGIGNKSTVYVGIALKISANPRSISEYTQSTVPGHTILNFNSSGNDQAYITIEPNGALGFRVPIVSGANTTLLGSSSLLLSLNTWYYLEVKYSPLASNTTNSNILRINGTEYINIAAGVRTNYNSTGTSTTINTVQLGPAGVPSGSTVRYSDYWITDDQFLGDVAVTAYTPSANGDLIAWTPNTGSNYEAIDEAVSDGDTSYIETNNVNARDSFHFPDLVAGAEIKGINIRGTMKKTDAGSRVVQPFVRIGSTNYDQSQIAVSDDYVSFQQPLLLNPATGQPFTATEYNAAQFGVKLTS